jgi:hypothetical protein
MLRVFCVNTGTKYSPDYVLKLRNMVSRHLSLPYEFWCLTDKPTGEVSCKLTPFNGWWGKISLFEEQGPVLYFDLDTVIVGSIDSFAEAVMASDKTIFMLKRFVTHRKGWMSGIMGWNGDWSFIRSAFDSKRHPNRFPGDQDFIDHILRITHSHVLSVQSVLGGVYSYKVDVRGNGSLPENTSVVCFHGNPRPHEINDKWISENWK